MLDNMPPGEDGLHGARAVATTPARQGQADIPLPQRLLKLVGIAEASADRYADFVRKAWSKNYKAFRNEHHDGSKYLNKDWRHRSALFRPKTRGAVRKTNAAIAASLFSTVDAVSIQAGNEGDPNSRANAALMQEIVNYRLDRTSGRNAIPWFLTAVGASQDATLTGICVSKQYWKLQTKTVGEQVRVEPDPQTGEEFEVWEEDPETGVQAPVMDPIRRVVVDRPDIQLIAPENVIIDANADWTDPAQSAGFLFIKHPMKLDDIRQAEHDPQNPWHHLEESVLRTGKTDRTSANPQGIRSAREGGVDRRDQTNSTDEFATIWVYECYVRVGGEDYTFFSISSQHLLTDPKPVEEVYPWNGGDRPIRIGYGSLESHKIFPMAPAESWQPLQQEINDLANLTLDTVKMNVAPLAKVKRGRSVDLDALRKRGPGTNLLLTDPADVEFDKPPGVDGSAFEQMNRLSVDMDSLAGQFDSSSVQTNRQLNETVGGMRLITGAANALQEFDQRIFFETWAEPVIGMVVKLCQYYEHDQTIIALCGERAELREKYGVSEITNELLDAQITTRIDIGIGAGDPQQRIAKFQMAVQAAMPLLQSHPKFQSGEYELDADAIIQEVFGAAGYRDAGQRFIKRNPPKTGPNPMQEAELAEKQASAAQKRSAATLNDAKAASTAAESRLHALEVVRDLITGQRDHMISERDKAIDRGNSERDRQESATTRQNNQQHALEIEKIRAAARGQGAGGGQPSLPAPAAPAAPPEQQPEQPAQGNAQALELAGIVQQLLAAIKQPRQQQVEFIRDAQGNMTGARMHSEDGLTRVVQFQRRNGRIVGATTTDTAGGGASPIELPPPDIQSMVHRAPMTPQ